MQGGLKFPAATEAWQKKGGTFEIRGCTNAFCPQVDFRSGETHPLGC